MSILDSLFYDLIIKITSETISILIQSKFHSWNETGIILSF